MCGKLAIQNLELKTTPLFVRRWSQISKDFDSGLIPPFSFLPSANIREICGQDLCEIGFGPRGLFSFSKMVH